MRPSSISSFPAGSPTVLQIFRNRGYKAVTAKLWSSSQDEVGAISLGNQYRAEGEWEDALPVWHQARHHQTSLASSTIAAVISLLFYCVLFKIRLHFTFSTISRAAPEVHVPGSLIWWCLQQLGVMSQEWINIADTAWSEPSLGNIPHKNSKVTGSAWP